MTDFMKRSGCDKHRLLRLSSLCLTIAFYFYFSEPFAMAKNVEPILMEIVRAGRRISPATSNGCIVLRFINLQAKEITIPLEASSLASPQNFTWQHRTTNPMQARDRVDFATLQFEWTNSKGLVKTKGQIDIFGDTIHLTKGNAYTMFLPIQIPKTPGIYSLHLTFDNRQLKEPARTHSNIGTQLTDVFFEGTAQKAIEIGPQMHY